MNLGKLALAALVTAVIMYLTDWMWYTKLMVDYFTPMPNARPEPLMLYLILGILIYSVAFVYIYTKGATGGTPMGEGARFGFWATLLAWIPMGFVWYALLSGGSFTEYVVDMVYRLVQMCVLGIIVAYMTGMGGARGKGATGGDD